MAQSPPPAPEGFGSSTGFGEFDDGLQIGCHVIQPCGRFHGSQQLHGCSQCLNGIGLKMIDQRLAFLCETVTIGPSQKVFNPGARFGTLAGPNHNRVNGWDRVPLPC